MTDEERQRLERLRQLSAERAGTDPETLSQMGAERPLSDVEAEALTQQSVRPDQQNPLMGLAAQATEGWADDQNSLLYGLQRGVTLGQDANITALLQALGLGAGQLVGLTDNEQSFSENFAGTRQQHLDTVNASQQNSPFGFALGEAAGVVAPSGAIGSAVHGATQGLPKAAQHLAQGGAAALEGLSYALGTDMENPAATGALSGIFGAAGSRVSDALPGIADYFSRHRPFGSRSAIAERQAVESLTDLAGTYGGADNPRDISALLAERQRLGDQGAIMDLSPEIRQITGSGIGARTDPAVVGRARSLSQSRDIETLAAQEFGEIFAPNISRSQHAASSQDITTQLQAQYNEVLNDAAAAGTVFEVGEVSDIINRVFPVNSAGQDYRFRSLITTELDRLGGETGIMDTRSLLNMKKIMDEVIPTHTVDGAPMTASARRNLIEVKNGVNDLLKERVPGYEEVAATYADEYQRRAARELGEDTILKRSYTTEDMKALYDNMSELEKLAFAEGARHQIQIAAEAGGNSRLLSRNIAHRLEPIFGTDTAHRFIDAAHRINSMQQTNRLIDSRSNSAIAGHQNTSSPGLVGSAADAVSLVGAVLTGRSQSGQAFGSGRRLSVDARRAGDVRRDEAILDMATRRGEAADQMLRDIEEYLLRYDLPNEPSGAARGGAGGLGTLLGKEVTD